MAEARNQGSQGKRQENRQEDGGREDLGKDRVIDGRKVLGSRRVGFSEVKPALGESWRGPGAARERGGGDPTGRRGTLPTQSMGQGPVAKKRESMQVPRRRFQPGF